MSKHVLITGPAWVGDMVMAQSLFKLVKARKSKPQIDVIAPSWSAPILQRMPEVDNIIELNIAHGELGLKKRYRLGKQLQQYQYDQAIILPRSLKAALTPFFASITQRTGFLGEMRYGLLNDIRLFDKQKLDQTVKRFAALGLEPNASVDNLPKPELLTDSANIDTLFNTQPLHKGVPAIALLTGAEYGPAKQWPIDYYHQLARQIVAAGYQVWVIGSGKDEPNGQQVVSGLGDHAINLCGKTSLGDAIDLLSVAEQCVSNDSGLMHVAAAVNTPVVAIYGSSSPSFTPPLTDTAIIHHKNLECSPCFKRQCPLGHLDCLKSIRVDEVAQSLSLTSAQ